MKLVLLLASHDETSQDNYDVLSDVHGGLIRDSSVGLIHRQLIKNNNIITYGDLEFVRTNRNPFDKINIADRADSSVELVAHGNPKVSFELLSLRSPDEKNNETKPTGYQNITPAILEKFFKIYAYQNNSYKFTSLTLYCCTSNVFAQELSQRMPDIKISCFNVSVHLHRDDATPLHGDTPIAPQVYLNGARRSSLEEKIDETKLNNPTEATAPTLSATRTMISGANPDERLRSQSVDSYLPKRKTITLEKIPVRPSSANDLPSSEPTTLRKRR